MNKCSDCAYCMSQQGQTICGYSMHQINSSGVTCQFFSNRKFIDKCDVCGSPIIGSIICITPNHEKKIICEKCSRKTGTCDLCKERFQCAFETSTCPFPKTVFKQVQGNNSMNIMRAEVKNPERVKETCEKMCPCWDKEEKYCLRESGTCGRYELCFG